MWGVLIKVGILHFNCLRTHNNHLYYRNYTDPFSSSTNLYASKSQSKQKKKRKVYINYKTHPIKINNISNNSGIAQSKTQFFFIEMEMEKK